MDWYCDRKDFGVLLRRSDVVPPLDEEFEYGGDVYLSSMKDASFS